MQNVAQYFGYAVSYLDGARDKYEKALAEHTKFGMYETHKSHIDHEIFDRDTFDLIPILRRLKGKTIKQMGSSAVEITL
ncbi:hypothetical protein LDL59_16870 [Kaistella anthropi]|nr:hypothetical protein [Kaistella anthropi]